MRSTGILRVLTLELKVQHSDGIVAADMRKEYQGDLRKLLEAAYRNSRDLEASIEALPKEIEELRERKRVYNALITVRWIAATFLSCHDNFSIWMHLHEITTQVSLLRALCLFSHLILFARHWIQDPPILFSQFLDQIEV